MPNSMHYFIVRILKIFVLVSALQKIQNETYIKKCHYKKTKKSATFKQEDLISSKSGQHKG